MAPQTMIRVNRMIAAPSMVALLVGAAQTRVSNALAISAVAIMSASLGPAACGGGSASGAAGGAGDATSSTGGNGGSGMGANCTPTMKFGGGETTMKGLSATATVVDEKGLPVDANQPVYLCGIDICAPPGRTTAAGGVSIQSTLSMKGAALKVGDGITYAELAIPLAMLATDFTTGGRVLSMGKLSDKPEATLTPGASATSGDVTMALAADASVGIDTLLYTTPDSQKFRAVSIPMANEGPIFDRVAASTGGATFSLYYGVSPAETTICPAAKLTVELPHATTSPNDLGWSAGTVVEFWVTTTDTGQTHAPYAGWAKMSDGVVAADGASASTTDGQGMTFLASFALRRKP